MILSGYLTPEHKTRRAKGIWLSADHFSARNRKKNIVLMDLDLALLSDIDLA
jgi:hypothetical protein